MPPKERHYETAKSGNKLAETLCYELFAPAADFFSDQDFLASEESLTGHSHNIPYEDGRREYFIFSACKTFDPAILEEDEGNSILFEATKTSIQYYNPTFYRPGTTYGPIFQQRERFMTDFDPDKIDETWMVEEVRSYYIDTDDFTPQKLLMWKYYDPEGKLMAEVQGVDAQATDHIDGDDRVEVTDFRIWEAELSDCFDMSDVEEVKNILKHLGFASAFTYTSTD